MGSLFRYEGRKLRHSVAFYILLGVGVLLVAFTVSLTRFFSKQPDGTMVSSTAIATASSALSNGMFSIVAGLFVSIFLCEDYGNGTIKNVLARGYTRAQVHFAKYLVSLLGVVLLGVADIGAGFLLGWVYWGQIGTLPSTFWASVLAILLSLMAYHALFAMIALLLRKMAGVVSINIVAPLAMNLILSALDMAWTNKGFSLSDYWIGGLLSNASATSPNTTLLYASFGILAAYIVVFFLAGYFPNRKRDLK